MIADDHYDTGSGTGGRDDRLIAANAAIDRSVKPDCT